MNFHEEQQAQLLDEYLTALQQNPNAPVPNGLEPEMATFAQLMLSPETDSKQARNTQDRVWQSLKASPSPDIKTIHTTQENHIRMSNLQEKNKRSSTMSGWLPLAATAIIAIVVSLTLSAFLFRNDEPNQADQPNSSMLMTSTPLPIMTTTFTPTAVPSLTATFLPTVTPPADIAIITTTPSAMLMCDFDDEFTLRINQNEIAPDDTLIIDGAVYNTDTALLIVEIFGGFLTEDEYQTITEIDTMPSRLQVLARVDGTDYPAGSYLVGLDLKDNNGETLSRCSLPVVFTD